MDSIQKTTVSLFIILFAVLCVAAPAMGATWMVNPDGSGNFTTIQAAVDSNWTSGDTIRVEYARYDEAVSVAGSGKTLHLTGMQDATGAFPVIDAMGGENALSLADGDFFIDGFMVTNATAEGMKALGGLNGTELSVANLSATANEWDGIAADDFANITFQQIESYENGWNGLAVEGYVDADISTSAFFGNGEDGLYAAGENVLVCDIYAAENGDNGIAIFDEGSVEIFDSVIDQQAIPSSVFVDQVYTVDNGGNGIEIFGNESGIAMITNAETNTNDEDGILVTNQYLVIIEGVTADGNGKGTSPILSVDDARMDGSLEVRTSGNGIWIRDSFYALIENVTADGNGIGSILSVDDVGMDGSCVITGNGLCISNGGLCEIFSVEASGNYNAGIHLEETIMGFVDSVEVSENWYGINEVQTGITGVQDSYAYSNYVDYRYDRTGMEVANLFADVDSIAAYDSYDDSTVLDMSGLEYMDSGTFDGVSPENVSYIYDLQVSDPADKTIMPSVVSFVSNSTNLWVGQTNIDVLYPPFRYHDASLMYMQIWGDAGSVLYHQFWITPEFPPVTAEGLSGWGIDRYSRTWERVADGFNMPSDDGRVVGGIYTFPEEMILDSGDSMQSSAMIGEWGHSGFDGIISGEPSGPVSLLAPFWYEEPGGDDESQVIHPTATSDTSGDGQTGDAGTDTGSGDIDGATQSPTSAPTAGSDDSGDGGNATATMTPAPVSETGSPTVTSPQMPADAAGGSGSGFLPWVVLIVVLVAIAGVFYFMKFQKK